MPNDARPGFLRVLRKLPAFAVIVFYLPAAIVALGGTALFSAAHRRAFGYPVDLTTSSGRLGNALWMPCVVAILLIGGALALAETILVLAWIGARLFR